MFIYNLGMAETITSRFSGQLSGAPEIFLGAKKLGWRSWVGAIISNFRTHTDYAAMWLLAHRWPISPLIPNRQCGISVDIFSCHGH